MQLVDPMTELLCQAQTKSGSDAYPSLNSVSKAKWAPGQTRYRETAPPDHLCEHVVCFWHSRSGAEPETGRVLPDGCVDVIWSGEQSPCVAGPMTAAFQTTSDPGAEIIGVRLRPGVAHHILDISARDLLNQHVPLRDFWPRERALRWEDVIARETLPARLHAVGEAIAERLEDARDRGSVVTRAASWLARHPRAGVTELSDLCGLSERQVRRQFHLAVGYGPKQLQRILRLQYLLWLASRRQSPRFDLAQLAIAAGYADQPHMTREVRALTGLSPGQLLCGPSLASAIPELFQPETKLA
jgi:AraC-like DNA-binding protein